MKYTTLLLSGVPQKVEFVDLSYCLNRLFYTDDEIGSFALRDLPNDGNKRQIALDFRSVFDAIAAQSRLHSYHYKLPDGGEYTLCAKITWKEEFMRQETSSPEPCREDGSVMGAEEPWPGMALVPTASDDAIYQANAKLDAQLKLLNKQKLILQTERKLLRQKRKLKKEYAAMYDNDSDDQPTTSKRRRKTRKSRSRCAGTRGPQDLQISSSGPKDLMSKLKALMSFNESKSMNLKRKSRQKESRSRCIDQSPESLYKDVNAQGSKWHAFDIHPKDRISMLKRSVSDYRSTSPEKSPRVRRSGRWDTRCSSPEISGSSKSRLRSNIKELERESRSRRSRSRERPASYRSRSREILASYRSRSRERPASYRSRSREILASYRSRSRERPASYRSRSREILASYRSRSRERPASYRSRSREILASYRSRSRERPASYRAGSRERLASYRSSSRERDPSREKNRRLAIMPKSPEITRSQRIRSVTLTSTSQSKEATMSKYNSDANITIFVDVIPRKQVNGDKNKTDDDSNHSKITKLYPSNVLVSEYTNTNAGFEAPVQKNKIKKETSAIEEKATSSIELSTINEETTSSKALSSIKEKATSIKELSAFKEKATSSKELLPIKEKVTTSKELSAIKETTTSSKDCSAIKEKATSIKELSAIKEEATMCKELNAIKEKATSSKGLSAIKGKATSSKELSAIKEKATTSKVVSKIKEKATSSKKLSAIKEKGTMSKELSAIKEKTTPSKEISAIKKKATTSMELIPIKEKVTTSKELSAIKEKTTSSKDSSAIKEKATSSKELSALKEKATTCKEVIPIMEKATSNKELSAIKEKATTSKEVIPIMEKATSNKELSAIKEKATTSKEVIPIKEKVTTSKEFSASKEKNTSCKDCGAIKEEATSIKELSAMRLKATSSKDLSAIKEKATSSKDLSAINEKATSSKELIPIKEKVTTSKELSAINEKTTSSKELSAIKEKATTSKEISAIKEKTTSSNDCSAINEKATSIKELSAIKEKATWSKELSAIKENATSSKELSAIKEKATSSKELSEFKEKVTSSTELSAIKEKATTSNILASKCTLNMTGSKTPNKKYIYEDFSAKEEVATEINVLVSKYAHTKVAAETPDKNTVHKVLGTNKEKTTPSNGLDSENSHTKMDSDTQVIERIRNIENGIMRLMHNILKEISLKKKRVLSENQKALIDDILSASILNRIKPLMAGKNVTEEQVVLNYRELYSKEEDTLLISELLDGIPKERCKKAERGDCTAKTGLVSNSFPHLPVKPGNHNGRYIGRMASFACAAESGDDAAHVLVSDGFRHLLLKSRNDDPSGEDVDNMEKHTISEATDRVSDPGVSIINWECNEITPVPREINKQNINNLTIPEVIDVNSEEPQNIIDVEKTASNILTIAEETKIKDLDADNKEIIIKDEAKPSKAKSKRATKTSFIDITFDKNLCPIPARPQFVLVLKKLLKQMKNTIKTAENKGLRGFPMSMFKCALRTMLKNLVAGKGYLGTSEIVKLFRAKYPKEEDYVLVNQFIEDINMGKYGKCTEVGHRDDKDDDKDDVILIENKSDVVIVLDSDDDVDQIKSHQKPNLDDVKPIERELQNIQRVEAEPTLQSQDQCNIVKAKPNKYPTTVVNETSQINKVITSNDEIPVAQFTGSRVSAAYLPINGFDRGKANQTNSSVFLNCTKEPIKNIKEEIQPEFTDAAVENLLDSLKDFDNVNDVNDTEKETPQVTAIIIMTSFSELISLKNEINQSSYKVGNVSTDIEANEIKIENDIISNAMIKTECVPGDKQYGQEISPNEGRDNNVSNKVIQEREVGKPNESGPTVVDGYDAYTTNTKPVPGGDEEESIESITKYLDSICYY